MQDKSPSWTTYVFGIVGFVALSIFTVISIRYGRLCYRRRMRSVNFYGPDMYVIKNKSRVLNVPRRKRNRKQSERIPTAVSTVPRNDDPVLLSYVTFDAM
ncbi:hypothetical protein RvY_02056 [Ramazzottius varieornatus]|uniref:Uncharacterized protein n=1 Tax=Ramazzottius varieornatus TaxID=947166 RepID=A0A1D1UPD6_RAMVA|nr:hypothetical protein RvY_02056 [Ramazzottius varieornatus]